MALSKDEMDFVIQLIDRRSLRPTVKPVKDIVSGDDIIDEWIKSYFIRDIQTTIIIEPKP